MNRLTLGVGELKTHEVFARYGFHDPDIDQTERPGQILGQVDDLTALDTRGRFYFVAGNDRTGLCRHHHDANTEIRQFLFYEARGVLDGLGRYGFGALAR